MARITVVFVLLAVAALTRPVPAAAGQGATVGGVAAAASTESGTEVSVAGAIGYRLNRVFGFGVEVMSVPTLIAPSEAAQAVASMSVPASAVSGTDGRAIIFTTNVRIEIPVIARVIPYVAGGGGVGNVTENFTMTLPVPSGIPVVMPPRSVTQSSTDLVLTLGGGVSMLVAAHLSIDVDLRYLRLIADRDRNVRRFGVGLSYRF
jgi:opacity protein-like surface antigen